MGLGLDICALAARPSHASLRLLRRSAAITQRAKSMRIRSTRPLQECARLLLVSTSLANFFFTKCYANAAYPSPTDESGFDKPPSSSAATSS